ncbi:mismatch-specific DNA-glycosylase [Nitrospirillum viridazoti]|uniref:Mismatch-specific DNA-glycosylase n=1 Tax=Nitrospirillum viridazoti CBAmc TaxID=1441467 RepID=A0A248JQU8_9PROT|nr:mismatch-specific DNA-glycosylase [Nitrospirillum amazonense]ASG20458.1 mismatch-specific DNA-glycosylase [Nitrospirillum amazonense CBAmc]
MLIPDVLVPGLHLVFCGTAPSRASMAAKAYYAKPGNAFWPSLHAAGFTPTRLTPQEYPGLPGLGLGLTDLNKTQFGNDVDLDPAAYDVAAFVEKMRRHRPGAVAFTSKTAASVFLTGHYGLVGSPVYGRQAQDFEGIALFVLPSPSGQARRFFTLDPWREAAAFVAGRRAASAGLP